MYQYTAECTAWICVISQFDSEVVSWNSFEFSCKIHILSPQGPQPFSIRMSNATFSVNVNMDTVDLIIILITTITIIIIIISSTIIIIIIIL